MKVGTDGVLLGAWASLDHNPNTILDIGAGTGLIALQMAQRSTAETIDAIELDEGAYEQCVENFEASRWADRLFCYHAHFSEFVAEMDEEYDLIISNPPFYSENVSSRNISRDKARQNESLSFPTLFNGVTKLLSKKGEFALVLPHNKENQILDLARNNGLFAFRITRLKGNVKSAVKRSLLQFSFDKNTPRISELIIEHARHHYTQEYVDLTKDFYLKM